MNEKMINVFIIGLRGYTQNYGGWETFAHGLLDNWRDLSVHFFVYEKVSEKTDTGIVQIDSHITCIRIYEPTKDSSSMVKYDKLCTDYSIQYIDKNQISNSILFYLGVRIGPYVWLKKRLIKKMGIKILENPAGVEWKRTKWGKILQVYIFISAMMMAKTTDYLVCDNEGIEEVYKKILIGRKPQMGFVPYGVDSVARVSDNMPDRVSAYFSKLGIEKDKYYLVLSRFVPENNYEMVIKGFIHSKTNRKLLIISNYNTEIAKFYNHIKKSTNFTQDSRVIFSEAQYDKDILHYVRQYAHGYIHGHSVGGTNPGLLEAMSETDISLLYDVSFNRYVGNNCVEYFNSAASLSALVNQIDLMNNDEKENKGIQARKRMLEEYSWEKIVCGYNQIFRSIIYWIN